MSSLFDAATVYVSNGYTPEYTGAAQAEAGGASRSSLRPLEIAGKFEVTMVCSMHAHPVGAAMAKWQR
jgi:hypothetical protein